MKTMNKFKIPTLIIVYPKFLQQIERNGHKNRVFSVESMVFEMTQDKFVSYAMLPYAKNLVFPNIIVLSNILILINVY